MKNISKQTRKESTRSLKQDVLEAVYLKSFRCGVFRVVDFGEAYKASRKEHMTVIVKTTQKLKMVLKEVIIRKLFECVTTEKKLIIKVEVFYTTWE